MKRKNKFGSIKLNMILYSFSIILLMTVLSIYILSILYRYQGQIETMFEKHIYLAEIEDTMAEIDNDLLGFLTTKSSTKLNDYRVHLDSLLVYEQAATFEVYTMDDLMMKNIIYLIDAYEVLGDEAIAYKRQRNVVAFTRTYQESLNVKDHIFRYIDQLNDGQLNKNAISYLKLVNQIKLLQMVTILIVLLFIAIAILIVYYISSRLVKPIGALSHAAEEIAAGKLNTPDVVVESDDEWRLLADAFNKMKNSISLYIEEVKFKAEMENTLKDEQLKNIKMAHLLDKAKLYALQSQINPHFLFNTINAGVQMAIMERASKTGDFLDTMSRLFRYNIQKIDSKCTLKEEVDNIEDYYNLLKVRFGHRIRCEFNIDPSTLNFEVPPLILQPLVENAYIHGLSSLEQGGVITVSSYKKEDSIYLTVSDTGVGMSPESIYKILSKEDDFEDDYGIGVRNVRDRLELYFHKTGIFRIESQKDMGLKIIIEMPIMESGHV